MYYKQRRSQFAETVHSRPGATILAFDYHQVLDVDRLSRYKTVRIEDYLFPERHQQLLRRIRNLLKEQTQGRIKLVLVSHIHNSETNLRNLLNTVERSQSPFWPCTCDSSKNGTRRKTSVVKRPCTGWPICNLRRQSADYWGVVSWYQIQCVISRNIFCRFSDIFCHLVLHFFFHFLVVFSSGASGWTRSRPGKSKNVILPARESFMLFFHFSNWESFCCIYFALFFSISKIGSHFLSIWFALPKPKWQ